MPGAESKPPVRGSLSRLLTRLARDHGVDLSQYRETYLERRVAARMRDRGFDTYRRYGDFIDEHPEEIARLLDAVSINVTEFFRDKVVWNSIRTHAIPDILERKRGGKSRSIRVWSAGCATGEEPYSIAMMLLGELGDAASNYLITVMATDVDETALAAARRARYPRSALRGMPVDYRLRFTRAVGDAEFEILPEVRKLVRFHKESLAVEPPSRHMDMVLCRNVFIYFERDRQAQVLEGFWKAMAPGGYLVLGRSEKLSSEAAERFENVNGRERVYRKPSRVEPRGSARTGAGDGTGTSAQ